MRLILVSSLLIAVCNGQIISMLQSVVDSANNLKSRLYDIYKNENMLLFGTVSNIQKMVINPGDIAETIKTVFGSIDGLSSSGRISDISQDIGFYLYTRRNPNEPQILDPNDLETSLTKSYFNASYHTHFLTHGYMGNLTDVSIQQPKDALLQKYDVNIIAIDYGTIAELDILTTLQESRRIGYYIALMVKLLQNYGHLDLSRTYLCGYSLGAHIMGFVGKHFKGGQVARITALDPGFTGFARADKNNRLDASDAAYVLVIHSNGNMLGLMNNIGTADIYLNGGIFQPGCFFFAVCCHIRSIFVYVALLDPLHKYETLNCTEIPDRHGTNCIPSNASLDVASERHSGIFYVKTTDKHPYTSRVKDVDESTFVEVMEKYMDFRLGRNYSSPYNYLADHVFFFLYTRMNPNVSQRMMVGDDECLMESNFDSLKYTYVLVHGYLNSGISYAIQGPKGAFLDQHDCNVICVDWGNIAETPSYPTAAAEVKRVGAYVARLLRFLKNSGNLDLERTMVIGHSLGAHIAGFVGKTLTKHGLKLNRIIGLDPALPGFSLELPKGRLCETDADHVEIIHTNGGFLGMQRRLGTVDFYSNGGKSQPGCSLSIYCSHNRAVDILMGIVTSSNSFKAKNCTSIPDETGSGCEDVHITLGDPRNKGIFFFETSEELPFIRHVTNM